MVGAMETIVFPRSVWRDLALPAVVALAVSAGGIAALRAARTVEVSQKDRMFQPGALVLERGDLVEMVNDDGPLLHHAYVSTPEFSFDSGEQLPGNRTEIRFTVPGTFTVRCAIHPKMHLYVTVR
ncbi:MAG: hypothetical protein ACRYG6_07205 [Janthinobacterium lividum]